MNPRKGYSGHVLVTNENVKSCCGMPTSRCTCVPGYPGYTAQDLENFVRNRAARPVVPREPAVGVGGAVELRLRKQVLATGARPG
jgi:hypothetical protein